MAIDRKLLKAFLSQPTIAAKTDADALTAANTGTLVPRTELITTTVLSRSDVWGFALTAQVRAKLGAAIAAGQAANATTQQQTIAAEASQLLSLLDGPGLSATDPQVGTVSSGLVTAQLITQAQSDAALKQTNYPAGGQVTLADIQSVRRELQTTKLQTQALNGLKAVNQLIATANASNAAMPTAQQLQAVFTAAVTG